MNFLSTLSCDLALLKGKLGCRPGAFLLYFGCRYCTLLSIISLLAYTDFMAIARIDVSNYMTHCSLAVLLTRVRVFTQILGYIAEVCSGRRPSRLATTDYMRPRPPRRLPLPSRTVLWRSACKPLR